MISPVTATVKPRMVTPNQNQVFSPKLKRPEGTWLPSSRPPARRIHTASIGRHTLSRRKAKNISSTKIPNSGPT